VLDDEVGIGRLDQICNQLLTVKADVSHHQERLFDHGPAMVKALRDEFTGPWRTGVGTVGPELGVDHPASAQMDEYGMEPELIGVGELGFFLLGIGVVKDDRIDVHADPGSIVMLYILGFHTHLLLESKRACRQVLLQSGLQAQGLEPLPENLGRRRPGDAKGCSEELVLPVFLDVVKVCLALAEKPAQRSQYLRVLYL
jgi:hypothetical protein